ncbi:hypothetical protein [Streptomyces sp. NPDC059455]|uniref:hypothetical protein n=1 Tax=Streptomyces sp. NPDC059455 TaxID=3346837 RepID=UPI0036CD8DEF
MLNPATPKQLAALDALLCPSPPPTIAVAMDAADVHAETTRGRHTTEGLGAYCRTALPLILRRLLAVESDLIALRSAVAGHVASADQGNDPTPGELLEGLKRRGIDLRPDVAAAAALLEAEAHAAAFG